MARIGFMQSNPRLMDVEGNVERAVKKLGNLDFDLMVLPEFFNTGYNFKSRDEVKQVAESIPRGFTTQMLREVAVEKDACIVAGLVEKDDRGRLYNSAVVVTPKQVGRYRKTHLYYRENELFTPGDTGFNVFKFKDFRVGVMICFDWFFPESARTLALRGADVVAHPANLVLPYCPDSMKIRSLENHVYTVTANRVGSERGLKYIGKSQVTDPCGKLVYRASSSREETRLFEVDLREARYKRLNRFNDLFRDRRRKYYGF